MLNYCVFFVDIWSLKGIKKYILDHLFDTNTMLTPYFVIQFVQHMELTVFPSSWISPVFALASIGFLPIITLQCRALAWVKTIILNLLRFRI